MHHFRLQVTGPNFPFNEQLHAVRNVTLQASLPPSSLTVLLFYLQGASFELQEAFQTVIHHEPSPGV